MLCGVHQLIDEMRHDGVLAISAPSYPEPIARLAMTRKSCMLTSATMSSAVAVSTHTMYLPCEQQLA